MRRQILRVLDSRSFEVLVYLTIFLLNLRLCFGQTRSYSDITAHIDFTTRMFRGNFYLPHPFLHYLVHGGSLITGMPYTFIMPVLMAALSIISIMVSKAVIKHYRPGLQHEFAYLLAAVVANTVVAIFIPAYNPRAYLGQWSPNVWHNPTMAPLKPLAILGFWGTIHWLCSPNRDGRRIAWWTSLCLLAGTLAKPSFIICFIPAVGLFLLVFHLKDRRMWRSAFLLFLPSVCLLAWQFLRTYTNLGAPAAVQDKIVLSFFGVTKLFAPNVFVSTLLVWAFPLSVLLAIRKNVLRNPPLLLSYLLALVGFLQASFLAEKARMSNGNFIFGYIMSLFLVYLFSLIEYLDWWKGEAKTNAKAKGTQNTMSFAWKAAVSVILAAHLVSGLVYWRSLIMGQYNL